MLVPFIEHAIFIHINYHARRRVAFRMPFSVANPSTVQCLNNTSATTPAGLQFEVFDQTKLLKWLYDFLSITTLTLNFDFGPVCRAVPYGHRRWNAKNETIRKYMENKTGRYEDSIFTEQGEQNRWL